MNGLEDKADNAKAREAPFMARDHQAHVRQRCLRPSVVDDVCLHDARFGISPSTCTAHSGATKAHDWMVGVLGPLFRSRTHGPHAARRNGKRRPTARRRGNSELPASNSRGLFFDLSVTRVFKNNQPPFCPHPPRRHPELSLHTTTIHPRKESSKTIISSTAVPNVTARRIFASSFSTGPPGD